MSHLILALSILVYGLNLVFGFHIPTWETALMVLASTCLVVLQHVGARNDWTFLSGFRIYAA